MYEKEMKEAIQHHIYKKYDLWLPEEAITIGLQEHMRTLRPKVEIDFCDLSISVLKERNHNV